MNRQFGLLLGLASSAALGLSALAGCSAGADGTGAFGTGNNNSGAGGTNTGAANQGGMGQGANNVGGSTFVVGGGGQGGQGGAIVNPCGTECGPVELCDGANKGLDDDCDGTVDEDCPCRAGQASSCFKGDPSYLNDVGCNPGTMSCTELGTWGPCVGGNHATDMCFSADPQGCHPINAVPFQTIDLATGAGNFDDNADSETYTVSCPPGVNPCPTPAGTDYTALQSGEYTVTYTKTVNGVDDVCTFPLYIGARGLRVELSWNFLPNNGGTDLDLHMHQPGNDTDAWAISGSPADCGFANCTESAFEFGFGDEPHWFPDANMVPDPVNWYEDPDFNQNSCYFAPGGVGADWSSFGQGCHNPRLDLDNISCSPSCTDPTSQSCDFCTPENINVDFPPKEQWTRVAVHYYPGTSSFSGPVLPNVKIFCDGALAADLGTVGFHDPESPMQWQIGQDVDHVWLVADVLFHEDECVSECIVEPLYVAPAASKNPVVLTRAQAESGFGPPFPPIP